MTGPEGIGVDSEGRVNKLNTPEGVSTPTKEEFVATLKDLQRPITLEELGEILSSTVKYDEANKVITFLGMLLNYTNEDQVNIAFSAESSTGKSYIPLELAQYFPKGDILYYAYSSPTSFFHEYGTWIKELKVNWIDLERKICIFVDQPHDMLLQRLRPLLSHDQKVLTFKITDRSRKGGLLTKTVQVNGFPTVIFCSSKFSMEDQERTRLIVLSPEVIQEKLKASIELLAQKLSDRKKFLEELEANPKRQWLKAKVQAIKNARIEEVIIKPEDIEFILNQFFEDHKSLIPRHQRDFPRLIGLVKAHALLNLFQRERTKNPHSIMAIPEDLAEGYRLYKTISEANELGLPPEVYEVYQKVLEPATNNGNGITRKDFARQYYEVFHKTLGKKREDEILRILASSGLIREEPDPEDKRQYLIYSHPAGYLISEENHEKINTPRGVTNFFSILAEPRLGVCELCGQSGTLTHSFFDDKNRVRYSCTSCAKAQSPISRERGDRRNEN